jgi:hypothetical protein
VVTKVETNYSGFKDKVNVKTSAQYTSLKDSLGEVAKRTTNKGECANAVWVYTGFFKDQHLGFQANVPSAPKSIGVEKAVKPLYDSAEIAHSMAYLQSSKELKPIEGIWVNMEGSYKVMITRSMIKGQYDGVILSSKLTNWKIGELKMELYGTGMEDCKVKYFKGDKSAESTFGSLDKNFLRIGGFGLWQKISPSMKDSMTLEAYNEKYGDPNNPNLRWIDSATVLFTIPSFEADNRPIIDSLVKTNEARLSVTKHWIVDIRGNGGGSDGTFSALIPYLYTNPIVNEGASFWATDANIEKQREILVQYKSFFTPTEYKEFKDELTKWTARPNTMHEGNSDTTRFDKVLPFPKRVSVLINGGCASSAEQFIIAAKQSKKVVIYGTHSGGVIDYGDVRHHDLPCKAFKVNIPTTRHNWVDRKPIDNVGIEPDGVIPEDVLDWIDWVARVR